MTSVDSVLTTDNCRDGETGRKPRITGIGGTQRSGSSSEMAVRYALGVAANLGCDTEFVPVDDLLLPLFDPSDPDCVSAADTLLAKVRAADGLIIASPGYHGNVSGLLKNALDYFEAMAKDPDPYLHGRAVGCIVTAAGWQAGTTAMSALRTTVQALRGWAVPRSVSINSSEGPFDAEGAPREDNVRRQLDSMVEQVVDFSEQMRLRK